MILKKVLRMIIIFCLIIIIALPKANAITNVFNSNLVVIEDELETTGDLIIGIDINVSYKLGGYSAVLEYDKSKLELVDVTEEDKFSITYNSDYDHNKVFISGTYNKGKIGKFIISKLIFKKTSKFMPGDKINISLTEIKGDNDTAGIDNNVIVSIPGIMKVKAILADDTDITNEKKYNTNNSYVNIDVIVEYGKVISKVGRKELEIGENKYIITLEDEKGIKENIEIILIRTKENTSDNDKNISDSETKEEKTPSNLKNKIENIITKNIKTNDNIMRYVALFLISSLMSFVLIIIYSKYYKKN